MFRCLGVEFRVVLRIQCLRILRSEVLGSLSLRFRDSSFDKMIWGISQGSHMVDGMLKKSRELERFCNVEA